MINGAQSRTNAVDHEKIASLAISTYLNTLPPRGAKPGTKSNGRLEWTVLAAFILSFPSQSSSSEREYALISLGTGLKCLPYTSLPSHGDVLHDQHAEVLARRGARLWLLNRLHSEVTTAEEAGLKLLEKTGDGERWKLKQEVQMHLYVSTLPCGDASNKLLEFQRAAQDQVAGKEGALTPAELLKLHTADHSLSSPDASIAKVNDDNDSVMRGRASSSHPISSSNNVSGSLRTKPGRPDSPPSISMSCSDKIALWNAPGIGIQGSLLSALLTPIHINSITISDHPTRHIFPAFPFDSTVSQAEEEHRKILKKMLGADCKRALDRARDQQTGDKIEAGWSKATFPDSRESRLEQAWSAFSFIATQPESSLREKTEAFRAGHEPTSCPNSVLHIASPAFEGGKAENLASGTKMGAPTKRAKSRDGGTSEPLKLAARSVVCKLNYFQTFATLSSSISGAGDARAREAMLYRDAKAGRFGDGTKKYRQRKDELLGMKEDAQMTLERFLSRARDSTAIKGEQRQEEDRSVTMHVDATGVGRQGDEEEEGQEKSFRRFKGWLRTPSPLHGFNLQGHASV